MINHNIDNLIVEMDNPFAQFAEKFNLIQGLKTIGFTFIPLANIISLHNCYKRMFNYPIQSKVKGFAGQYAAAFASTFLSPLVIFIVYPMIYLNCLNASREETIENTNTTSIFIKLAGIYKEGISDNIRALNKSIDQKYKVLYKELSDKYAKLSKITDEELKAQIIKEYGIVTFDGIEERIAMFKSNASELSETQVALLKEIQSEYTSAKKLFFKEHK